jgi:hypothetical protein
MNSVRYLEHEQTLLDRLAGPSRHKMFPLLRQLELQLLETDKFRSHLALVV